MNAARMLTDTISVAEPTGRSDYGDPTYGDPVAIKARVEQGEGVGRSNEGETQSLAHRIMTATSVTMGARVWLPGADTSDPDASVRPQGVRRARTPDGYELWEIVI